MATIVAHEVSHQWFGNLVTMDWWSDLWLNEGFATFMQYYAVDRISPEFRLWEQFASDVLIPSLQLDALENSHPVKVNVRNPREIDEVFDKISYRKGASLIRMLHSVMGEETFQAGMRTYMATYAYGTATTSQLWTSLRSAMPGLDVAELMDCWVDNVGFPILKVSLVPVPDQAQPALLVTQERFSAAHRCNDGLLWRVPLMVEVRSAEGTVVTLPLTVLADRSVELALPPGINLDLDRGAYVKLNPGFVSYYRTDYSREMALALEAGMAACSLPPVDRLSTLEDRVSLVLGEQGNTVALMRLIGRLDREDSFLVWKNLSSFFHVLRCIVWSSEPLADRFDRFVVSAMLPCLERIGWSRTPGESHLASMLRGLLICQLGTRGCPLVEERCGALFTGWVEGVAVVEPGLREVVMKVAMASGRAGSGRGPLHRLLELLEVPQERNRVLHSLGYSGNRDVLARVLAFSLDPRLRDQESVMVIESVCQNRIGVRLAWDFFKVC